MCDCIALRGVSSCESKVPVNFGLCKNYVMSFLKFCTRKLMKSSAFTALVVQSIPRCRRALLQSISRCKRAVLQSIARWRDFLTPSILLPRDPGNKSWRAIRRTLHQRLQIMSALSRWTVCEASVHHCSWSRSSRGAPPESQKIMQSLAQVLQSTAKAASRRTPTSGGEQQQVLQSTPKVASRRTPTSGGEQKQRAAQRQEERTHPFRHKHRTTTSNPTKVLQSMRQDGNR